MRGMAPDNERDSSFSHKSVDIEASSIPPPSMSLGPDRSKPALEGVPWKKKNNNNDDTSKKPRSKSPLNLASVTEKRATPEKKTNPEGVTTTKIL